MEIYSSSSHSQTSIIDSSAKNDNTAGAKLPEETTDTKQTPFQYYKEKFYALTDIALDNSGKYTYNERLNANSEFLKMTSTGLGIGGGDEINNLATKLGNGDIQKKSSAIYDEEMKVIQAASKNGDSISQVKLNFFNGLSDENKSTYFAINIGWTDKYGNQEFKSQESYKNKLSNLAKSENNLNIADPTGITAATAHSLKTSLAIVNEISNKNNSLLKLHKQSDTITLSEAALEILKSTPKNDSQSNKNATPYKEGDIASKIV